MRKAERAVQIWPLLTLSAFHRQILSYDLLSRLIGVPKFGLGPLLAPIQSFCILKDLPALTCLVVSEDSGLPGEGFIAAPHVPSAQAAVFKFDWLSHAVPTVEELEAAVQELPCKGRSLSDLLKQIKK